MVSFNKFFTSVFLATIYTPWVSASPWPISSKFSTHRVRGIGYDMQVETYHPPSSYQTFGDGFDHPLPKRADPSLEEMAVSFVQSTLNIEPNSVAFKSGYAGETAKYAYVRQSQDGIPFANAVANVAFNNDNKVVAFGSSFVKPKSVASSTPSITTAIAITNAQQALNGTYNGSPATLEYFAKQDGSVVLTHALQIQNDKAGTWYEAFIDAHSGDLVSVTDFVAKASYKVLPIQKEILTQGFEIITNPQDLSASPQGWHSDGTTSTTVTAGNNVVAYKIVAISNLTEPQESSAPLNFIYTQNPTQAPNTPNNLAAAIVNAFYIVNTIHDFAYKYGFTEAAYNFQNNNFGKGGAGNDRVEVSVQDIESMNNADFTTPPDGQSGLMRMYLWDFTRPERDGALENDIIVHENTHGITNRMTGGGSGACLQTTEAGGLGEGWSDSMADWTEKVSSAVPDYVLGQYVTNNAAGIRTHPYSTSAVTNPLRYSSVKALNEVHNIGEVWANMLHNVYAALVSARRWSATSRTDPTGTVGNVVFLHNFLDALALQPCNPTFLTARDAFIQADANRYAGANKCLLWKTFASKGLGVNAANFNDDSSVPAGC